MPQHDGASRRDLCPASRYLHRTSHIAAEPFDVQTAHWLALRVVKSHGNVTQFVHLDSLMRLSCCTPC